ncbi:fungal pheromone STE3G-protein-coupled receptor [Tricholoma matsutake]|nr:fungal pheromone STE3G-protein-coupled receptor [Tricholoma matsutake 945]
MTTSNRIFSVFSFITFVFCCIPLRRHMQAWNIGICLNMAWTALACLNYFINSVIWNDNVNNPAPVWCDISSRIYLSSIIAIPVAVLCTTRRVYLITIGHMPLTTTQKHRAIMLDLALGLGIPLIFVILMYIPQRKRFIIFEDIGCSIAIDDDPISMVIGSGSQVVVSLACAAYSTLTIYTIYQKYSGLSELLSSNNTIDMSQYVRVLIIATLSSICVVPVALYMLVNNWITANSWPGLKVIHSDFSPVLVPASVWRSVQVAKYSPEIRRWGFVFNGFVIFACFGIHKEARRRYRLTAYHVFQCVSCFRVKKCFHSLFMCAIQLICYFTALERLQIMTQNLRLRGCCR